MNQTRSAFVSIGVHSWLLVSGTENRGIVPRPARLRSTFFEILVIQLKQHVALLHLVAGRDEILTQ